MTDQPTTQVPIELGAEATRLRGIKAAIAAENAKLRPVDHNGTPINQEDK